VIDKFSQILTASKSFIALYRMSPEKVQAFLNSYYLFEKEWTELDYNESVQKSLIDYYTVLNHLCAIAQVEKMYVPPALDLSKSIKENQNLFEEKMARDLGIKATDHVLEIGCGRGRISAHTASYTGAHITGMNIDPSQLQSARKFAARHGLSDRCRFIAADLNAIPYPFPDESFDHIYQVNVFSYAKNLDAVFKELFRLLKPGGRVACLDYVLKDAYDSSSPDHVKLVRKTKSILGAVGSPLVSEFTSALEKAGFKVTINADISINERQSPLIVKAAGKWVSRPIGLGIMPKHLKHMLARFVEGGDAFVKADEMGLLTTSWYIVAQK